MNTKDHVVTMERALDLALEALQTLMIQRGSIYDKAITAIKQARSAPVQEPVADVYMAGSMKTNICTNGRIVYVSTVYSEKPLVKGDKLYTIPPGGRQSEDCLTAAQRPVALPHKWVGLTKEETEWCTAHRHLIEWANDKLKEKNQ
jgi:hypothetical protein